MRPPTARTGSPARAQSRPILPFATRIATGAGLEPLKARHVAFFGMLTGSVSLALGVWARSTGRPWQSMVFGSLAPLQLGNAVAVRSERESVFTIGLSTNRFLLGAVIGMLTMQVTALMWAPLRSMLDLHPLSVGDLVILLTVSTASFWAIEAEKLLLRKIGYTSR